MRIGIAKVRVDSQLHLKHEQLSGLTGRAANGSFSGTASFRLLRFVRSDSHRRRVLRVRRAWPRVKSRPGAGFVRCDELRAGGRSYAYDLDYRADARDA